MVKVLKPFNFAGRIVHPGETISPEPEHEKQLVQGGLVEASAASEHATPAPPAGKATRPKAKAKPAKAKTETSRAAALTRPARPNTRKKIVGS